VVAIPWLNEWLNELLNGWMEGNSWTWALDGRIMNGFDSTGARR
jgi:hypothetical protein